MVPARLEFSDVFTVEEDTARLWVIEALDQRDDARLSAARLTTQGHHAILIVVDLY